MGSIISLDYYKREFAMTINLHKVARAAHIRMFSYVIIWIFLSAQLQSQ